MMLLRAIALALLALLMSTVAGAANAPADGAWRFEASLDGKPIGEHRFTVSTKGDERQVESRASFDVKLLGFTAYRYRHEASEKWVGGCLVALTASTDDDGKLTQVSAEKKGDALEVTSPTGRQALSGCVMSFAYWNPEIQKQSHLLNPQTGRYEPVQTSTVPQGMVDDNGEQVKATGLRIASPKESIDVWYSKQGAWLGLDSTVGGRKLTYRLK